MNKQPGKATKGWEWCGWPCHPAAACHSGTRTATSGTLVHYEQAVRMIWIGSGGDGPTIQQQRAVGEHGPSHRVYRYTMGKQSGHVGNGGMRTVPPSSSSVPFGNTDSHAPQKASSGASRVSIAAKSMSSYFPPEASLLPLAVATATAETAPSSGALVKGRNMNLTAQLEELLYILYLQLSQGCRCLRVIACPENMSWSPHPSLGIRCLIFPIRAMKPGAINTGLSVHHPTSSSSPPASRVTTRNE